MIQELILKTGLGSDRMIVSSQRRKARNSTLFLVLNMVCSSTCIRLPTLIILFAVWCWGWDGAGDLDGPDVDPVWERMPNKSTHSDAIVIRHDRSML